MRIAYHYSLFDNYRLILYYQAVKNYALKLDNRAAGELEGAKARLKLDKPPSKALTYQGFR